MSRSPGSSLALVLLLLGACAGKDPAASPPPREPAAVAGAATRDAAPARPAPDAALAPAAEVDLTLSIVIRRAKANPGSATGESYTNLRVAMAEGRWAFVGCVASVAGACHATHQIFLTPPQVAELGRLVSALDHMDPAAASGGCYRLLTTKLKYQPGDYEIDRKTVSYAGSLGFAGTCAPLALATWLAASGGL